MLKYKHDFEQEAVRFMFEPIDTNHNGVIEFDEFMKWYEKFGLENQIAKVILQRENNPYYLTLLPSLPQEVKDTKLV